MSEAGTISIVDRQFGGAYPLADEKGKPDTASPPGCMISTTRMVGVRLCTESRVESYILQGSKVIGRDPGDNTLSLDVVFAPDSPDNGVEEFEHPANGTLPGFTYRAFYTDDCVDDASMQKGNVITKDGSTKKQGFACSIF
ncbi:hypothetical protein H1R20_g10551, partial [Candolleomyces eurysporus]